MNYQTDYPHLNIQWQRLIYILLRSLLSIKEESNISELAFGIELAINA